LQEFQNIQQECVSFAATWWRAQIIYDWHICYS
jgi:hypothetical protein